MKNKKLVIKICELKIGEQKFHPRYLNACGEVRKSFIDFANAAHKQLMILRECNPENYIVDESGPRMKTLKDNFAKIKSKRIENIEKVLLELENGTFVLHCEIHHKCDLSTGVCRDLRKRKMAVPESINCVKFQERLENTSPIKQVMNG